MINTSAQLLPYNVLSDVDKIGLVVNIGTHRQNRGVSGLGGYPLLIGT